MSQPLILSQDQQTAYDAFVSSITNPLEEVFVLEGYAGTGKSTLVKKILEDLPATLQTVRLITQNKDDWKTVLTATTNKAAEALANITGEEVKTIQSHLGLRVKKDYKTGESSLIPHGGAEIQRNQIIFVDEASFIDNELLTWIFERTEDCKIVFIGDPAQLAPPKGGNTTPVFRANFNTARLSEVLRQASGNPIIDLATGFRNAVNGAEWPQATADGTNLIFMPDRNDFEEAIMAEFSDPDWAHDRSKVLAYTNRTVIAYNHGIRDRVEGVPELQEGDYAVCNSHIGNKRCNLKTDQTVMITDISEASEHGVDGWNVVMDYRHFAFLPASLADRKAAIAKAKAAENWSLVQHIDSHWIDLRAAYACTINKAQGSTYDRVFIDLDDVRACTNLNNMARLMYVAVSRARYQVIMTGSLVNPNAAQAA